MKRVQFFLPLFVIAVLLGGCPYKSSVGIDTPSVKINTALLGEWEKKGEDLTTYKITKQDDYTYRIAKLEQGKDKPEKFTAYISNVDGQQFLNLNIEAEGDGYYLYKFTLNSNTKVTLQEVTENITEDFTEQAALKAFISKNKGLSFFYSKGEDVYLKAN